MSLGKILATPAARRLARERGIDLAGVRGTGPQGSIRAKDVSDQKASARITPVALKMAGYYNIDISDIQANGKISKEHVVDLVNARQQTPHQAVSGRTVPIQGMRKVIAQRMQASMQAAPQYTVGSELDTTKLVSMLQDLKALYSKKGGKLSFTDMMVKLTALALAEHPIVNASISEEQIIYHGQINIGVAVALDEGLIVPVIQNADKLSLNEISEITQDLVKRARAGKLNPDEYSGGTFTISNMGLYPVDFFTPIINQPESGILGVGRTVEKPVVVDGQIAVRSMTGFSLTLDHRLVDGAVGGQFMATFKELLDNPLCILV